MCLPGFFCAQLFPRISSNTLDECLTRMPTYHIIAHMQRVTHGIPLPLSVGVGPVPKGGLTRRSHPFGCGEDRCGRSCCASLAPCHHILEHEARHETFGTWTCDHAVNGRVHPQGKGLTGWLFQGDWLLFDPKTPSPPPRRRQKKTRQSDKLCISGQNFPESQSSSPRGGA